MVLQILKYTAYGFVAILLLAVLLIALSSYLSLDRSFSHTVESNALPLYDATLPPVANDTETIELRKISANGFDFRTRMAGMDSTGDTVILLHGFPVTSAMWISLIDPLVDAGYRVVAFDQRGYSPGARPSAIEDYRVSNLVSDVMAIADAVAAESFHLIGHDWGSAVGWSTVLSNTDRIKSWTGISIAHPTAFFGALENDPEQQSRSRYFSLFSAPLVPELLLSVNGQGLLKSSYGEMAPASAAEYLKVFAEPRALSAALNWYRARGDVTVFNEQFSPEVTTPTLFIWGNQDPVVGRVAVAGQLQYIKGPYTEIELDGGHWLTESHEGEILGAVLSHLASANTQVP